MDVVQASLRRLRNWFVAWMVVQSVLGTALAAYVIDGMRLHPVLGHFLGAASIDLTVASGILGSAMALFLGLLVFASLLELRRWARIVLLVFGWIGAVGAALSVLSTPVTSAWLGTAAQYVGADAAFLGVVNVFTRALDLAFWGYLIYTLQVNPRVRAVFVATVPDAGPPTPRFC